MKGCWQVTDNVTVPSFSNTVAVQNMVTFMIEGQPLQLQLQLLLNDSFMTISSTKCWHTTSGPNKFSRDMH